jgi:Fe-S cluster biogenesis protein NfuA
MSSDLITRVTQAINEIRPFLVADGGDIELVEITDGKIARVKLLGACKSCSMSAMTIKAGVEESIKKAAPEITAVESVGEIVVA